MWNSGSPVSSAGAHSLTATMAAAGWWLQKQLNNAKLSWSPLVRASKARRCSSVMLVDMVIPVSVAQ